jgi:integrase
MAHVVTRKGKSGTTYQVKWKHPDTDEQFSLSFSARGRLDDPRELARLCAQWISKRGNRITPRDPGLVQEVFRNGVHAEADVEMPIVVFRDLAHDWCFKNRRRANVRTKQQYWTRFEKIAELQKGAGLMTTPVSEIDADDLSDLVTVLEANRSPNTVRSYMTCVQGVLRLAVSRGLISFSPYNAEYHTVEEVEPDGEVENYLTAEEVAAIVARMPADAADMVEFMYWTGLRISEVLCLQAHDCEFESTGGPQIFVRRHQVRGGETVPGTKSKKKGYRAQMRPGAEKILRARCANKSGADLVFPPPRAKKPWVYRDWLMHRFRPAVLAAIEAGEISQRKIGPHLLRHGCAVRMIEEGRQLFEIMLQFGHGDLKTTEKYYLHINDRIRANMNRIKSADDALPPVRHLALVG